MKRRAYILVEVLIGLALIVIILPMMAGLVFHELQVNQAISLKQETERQIDFTQQYLQSICAVANNVSMSSSTMTVVTSRDSYEVGLKNNAIYVRRDAYRYMTTDPVRVSQLQFVVINEKLCEVTLQANNKPYHFQLMMD